MQRLRIVVGFLLVGVALLTGTASAGLIGDSVHGEYLLPDVTTVAKDGGTQTISALTVFDFLPVASVTVTFSDTQIFVTNTLPGGFGVASFNGIDLAFLSGPALTNVVEDPASSPLFAPGSVLTFSANDIKLNMSSVCQNCRGGEQIILDVNTASSVPEPATLAFLGLAFAGIRLARRRKLN